MIEYMIIFALAAIALSFWYMWGEERDLHIRYKSDLDECEQKVIKLDGSNKSKDRQILQLKATIEAAHPLPSKSSISPPAKEMAHHILTEGRSDSWGSITFMYDGTPHRFRRELWTSSMVFRSKPQEGSGYIYEFQARITRRIGRLISSDWRANSDMDFFTEEELEYIWDTVYPKLEESRKLLEQKEKDEKRQACLEQLKKEVEYG